MSLHNRSLMLAFLTTLCFTLFVPTLFPAIRLTFFAPFLIITYYQRPFLPALWIAVLCGTVMDLLSSTPRLGIYALNYTLTTFLLYNQRRHFFADSLSTMPIMIYLFCFVSTVLQVVQLYIFDQRIAISWGWALTDLVIMPAFDALFSFCWFVLPFVFFGKPVRRGKEYFI